MDVVPRLVDILFDFVEISGGEVVEDRDELRQILAGFQASLNSGEDLVRSIGPRRRHHVQCGECEKG